MEDTGWRRNKYGGWFNINEVMNNKIRNVKDYSDNEEMFEKENQNILYKNQTFTDQQKDVIKEYTSEDGYGSNNVVNKYLNGEKQLSESAQEIVDKKIQTLDSCINQTLNNNIYVYRGINIRPKDLIEGQIIENKGFTSTSLYRSDASNFSVAGGATIKLKVNKGEKVLYIGKNTSAKHNEHELLFNRNKSIKIVKIEKLFDQDGDFMNYEIQGELI